MNKPESVTAVRLSTWHYGGAEYGHVEVLIKVDAAWRTVITTAFPATDWNIHRTVSVAEAEEA